MKAQSQFSYKEFTTRNLGFITQEQQDTLRESQVFVCGTGGMGGACTLALIRAGVGRIVLADIDRFEISNFNRQVFASLDTVGSEKAASTAEQCRRINPDLEAVVLGADWPEKFPTVINDCSVIVNGTDDLGASLYLYRAARKRKLPVIDAYASPLPSVYVTLAGEPMPEERLGYPTLNTAWNEVTDSQRTDAFLAELVYVLVNSTSRHYVDNVLVAEMAAGTRSRMSFAPMVVSAGMLMAYETINLLLRKSRGADNCGWFLNPYVGRIEKPRSAIVAKFLRPIALKYLRKQIG